MERKPVATEIGGGEFPSITWSNGVKHSLGGTPRQDLLKVAGAIARSRGDHNVATLKHKNVELRKYIENHSPWEAPEGQEAPKPKKHTPKPHTPKDGKARAEGETFIDERGHERKVTTITCSCSHRHSYRIRTGARYESTKKWLEGKPCPRCEKGLPMPEGDEQDGMETPPSPEQEEQENPSEPKQEGFQVPENLDDLADILAEKVMARMRPIEMPEVHHEGLPKVLKLVGEGLHVWLQGPPGTSKSTIALQTAEALKVRLYPISCHEQMTESKLFGYTDATGQVHRTALWDAFEYGGVLLLDEIDNSNSNLLAALNSLLSNGFATFAGQYEVRKHEHFVVVATANTAGTGPEAGFIGRAGVDLATLDRFVKVKVGIDNKLEQKIVEAIYPERATAILKAVRAVRQQVERRGMRVIVSPRTTFEVARILKAGAADSIGEALKMKALADVDEVSYKSLTEGLER